MNVLNLPPLSQFGVNSYLIWDENMNGALIDAPYGGDYILKQIAEKGVKLKTDPPHPRPLRPHCLSGICVLQNRCGNSYPFRRQGKAHKRKDKSHGNISVFLPLTPLAKQRRYRTEIS